ncbi:DNA-processing protein DprA [Reichenbachiella carrageenanivorans]|uniref:DNA-processing protein DprA n=1 Tax=Reichenbachiella carrageenanivorans TaxID=2979869 RepID=A0ABY6CZF0_9BACT|nr:DNA-processing protein DprA [Reichenbachiella carrageenanivorans]UXX79304.1 DNA-processing protein DprA [Reichenbachiella carrageenanivorans]
MNEEQNSYVLALKMTPGIGDVLAKQLISYCGAASAIFKEKKGALLKIPNIGEKTVKALTASTYLDQAEAAIRNCEKIGVAVLPYFHADYPERLKLVNDAPLLIYTKGESSFLNRKIVGVVGTRNATEYGKHMTEQIVEGLVGHEAVVVSGLAYGVDIAAHRAALKNHLPTVAVLAGGLDSIYPSVHKRTAQDMLEMGGWVSEYPPGTKPEAHNFPSRNRIIAGMSEALIVVEAANKGGALITANIAYSYNREVFAVPGTLEHKYSEGCNALIRSQKATIYTGIKDLEYLLGWEKGSAKPSKQAIDLSAYSEPEQKIISVLTEFKAGLQLDELSWKTQINVQEAVSHLLTLEFDGLVKSLPGKRYVRV